MKEKSFLINMALLGVVLISVVLKFYLWKNLIVLCFGLAFANGARIAFLQYKGYRERKSSFDMFFTGLCCASFTTVSLISLLIAFTQVL